MYKSLNDARSEIEVPMKPCENEYIPDNIEKLDYPG